jgi:metal-sulfur cluster biosynthetic enzyme
MPITKEQILEILRTCNDPEVGLDIVSLGLIYDVAITGQAVRLTMTLTTPGCPLVPYFEQEIVGKIKDQAGATEVSIDLTFDPPWDPGKMSVDARNQLTMMR